MKSLLKFMRFLTVVLLGSTVLLVLNLLTKKDSADAPLGSSVMFDEVSADSVDGSDCVSGCPECG